METAGQLVAALQLSVKSLQFYTAEHPRGVEALAQLEQAYGALLTRTARVTLTASKGTLLLDGQPMHGAVGPLKALALEFEKRDIGGLVLLPAASRRELLEVVRMLSTRPEQLRAAGGAEAVLAAADVAHVRVSKVRYEAVTDQEEVVWSSTLKRLDSGEAVTVDEAQRMIEAANADQLELLRERLAAMGITREQFDEVLDVVSWDKLPADDRVAKLLADNRIFDFPPGKLAHFVRELLDAGRHDDVHRIVECYVTGLTSDSSALRQSVSDGLAQMVSHALPANTEQIAGAALLNHVLREQDPRVKGAAIESAAAFLALLVGTSRSEPALRVIERLEKAAPQVIADLARALAERAEPIIGQICAADAETAARVVMPLVVRLGGAIAPAVIEALGNEEDRNRRGRLVKALKSIGEPAFPALVEALRSPIWYVVRNTLNVLGDVGTPAHIEPIGKKLEHGDPRVRRAAARALGKIGDAEAEKMLLAAIHDRDPETQAEVLLCLGAMKSTTAVPVLADMIRPKGFFTREVPMIRIAAEKALAAIDTPAARDALKIAKRA
ncbi:MAG TPA: HEAT repeat domain-containing protein [Thermoanaerobaculia bacterium]|nr:HEAT repeat domain-containing protein [Thermoanaerobaculia bacterium]